MGPIDALTKLAMAGKLTMEKVCDAGFKEMASAMEGAGNLAKDAGAQAENSGTKAMAFLTDKATGMGQQKGQAQAKGKDDGMDMEM